MRVAGALSEAAVIKDVRQIPPSVFSRQYPRAQTHAFAPEPIAFCTLLWYTTGTMKKDIHPAYHTAKVNCACGNTFTVGSTKAHLDIEICAACHPFYTGGSKLVDTAGRVEKFKQRLAKKKK